MSLSPLFDEFPPVSTEDWESKIREDLGGKDYDRMLVWDSLEGVTVQPYYRRGDLDGLPHVASDAPSPLVDASARPANGWRVRQEIAASSLPEANRLAREALDRGATDLGLVVDVPPRADTEGSASPGPSAGVPVRTVGDLKALLDDVALADVGLHLTGGTSGAVLLAMLLALAEERAVDPGRLRGSVHYDPAAALATGQVASPPTAFALAADLARTRDAVPGVRTLTVSAKPYHDAGASLVQELAFTLGALSETLAHLTDDGVALPTAVDALQFVVPVSTRHFLEIAKLRALRLLAPQVIGAFAAADDATAKGVDVAPTDLFVQAVTSQRTQTVYGPYVNMLRGTTEAMSAVLGGCDVLSVAPFDALTREPSSFSTRIARNTQLVLRDEAHADQVADPTAGSYYVEAVTDQLARRAWARFQQLESDGGLLAGLQSGAVQADVDAVRQKRLDAVTSRRRVLVGTNHYPDLDASRRKAPAADAADPDAADSDAADSDAAGAPDARSGSAVVMPAATVGAVRNALTAGATLADVVDALADADARGDGSADRIAPLEPMRLAAPFESLRRRTERHAAAHDGPPVVFLLPIGSASWRSARATFARNFFGVAGFDVVEPLRFDTPADGADAAVDAGADVVVLCSSDDAYADLAPAVRDALHARDADPLVVIAGHPDDTPADADAFVHKTSRLLDTLLDIQERLGVGD